MCTLPFLGSFGTPIQLGGALVIAEVKEQKYGNEMMVSSRSFRQAQLKMKLLYERPDFLSVMKTFVLCF
jgi:nitrate reductase assembly molybdenum cofactor insertion protein NarJ